MEEEVLQTEEVPTEEPCCSEDCDQNCGCCVDLQVDPNDPCNCPECQEEVEVDACDCKECTCEEHCTNSCECCCACPSSAKVWSWMLGDSASYAVVYFIILSLPFQWALVENMGERFWYTGVYFLAWLVINLLKWWWRASHGTLSRIKRYSQW